MKKKQKMRAVLEGPPACWWRALSEPEHALVVSEQQKMEQTVWRDSELSSEMRMRRQERVKAVVEQQGAGRSPECLWMKLRGSGCPHHVAPTQRLPAVQSHDVLLQAAVWMLTQHELAQSRPKLTRQAHELTRQGWHVPETWLCLTNRQ